MIERLQKIIARAGIASRRHAEELISSGMVTVNGRTITELGSKADESRDHIKVSGKLLRPASERVYLLLNKPAEVVSTMSDPEGRRSLRDLLHGVSERVFPVGRLEYHSSGLVFLTNDGELANRVLQSHQLRQTYHLKIKSLLTFEEIEKLSRSTGARISRIRGAEMPWYEVTLVEAGRDALRNKLFQFGHPVEKIKRVAIGNLSLDSLGPGHRRELSSAEVASLSKLVDGNVTEKSAAPQKHPIPRSKRRPEHANQKPRGKWGAEPRGKSDAEPRGRSGAKSNYSRASRPEHVNQKPRGKWGSGPGAKPRGEPRGRSGAKSNYSRVRRPEHANQKPRGKWGSGPGAKPRGEPRGRSGAKSNYSRERRPEHADQKPRGKWGAEPRGKSDAEPRGRSGAKSNYSRERRPEHANEKPRGKWGSGPRGKSDAESRERSGAKSNYSRERRPEHANEKPRGKWGAEPRGKSDAESRGRSGAKSNYSRERRPEHANEKPRGKWGSGPGAKPRGEPDYSRKH